MQQKHTSFLHITHNRVQMSFRTLPRWSMVLVLVVVMLQGGWREASAAPRQNSFENRSIVVGSSLRTYSVYVPQTEEADRPMPVLIALHGSNSNGRLMAGLTNFNAVADRFKFIVVYPNAVSGRWNSNSIDATNPDDVAFISTLLDVLEDDPLVDEQRVFAAGFSSGAVMTELLGCRLADRIAGIASVAGHMTADVAANCAPSRPLPVLTIHGTDDPIMAYRGWEDARFGNRFLGAESAVRTWAGFAACLTAQTMPLADKAPDDGTTIVLESRSACASQVNVMLYKVNGGGHTWPDGLQYLPVGTIGRTSRDINASTTIWQFFSRFSLTGTRSIQPILTVTPNPTTTPTPSATPVPTVTPAPRPSATPGAATTTRQRASSAPRRADTRHPVPTRAAAQER